MIQFEHVQVFGWEPAIRGMRNAMNSWENSDSFCIDDCHACSDMLKCSRYFSEQDTGQPFRGNNYFGPNDLELMQKLSAAGPVHGKFKRMIVVYLDITAPLYWWKEFDTYKVGTVSNSCSTMHKIHAKEFTFDDFSHEHLISTWIDDNVEAFTFYEGVPMSPTDILEKTIDSLNTCREAFLKTKDRKYWWQMIQLLPSSYNQRRTIMLDYEVLTSMFLYREDHKLDEWRIFCNRIAELVNSELITGRK